MSNSQHVCLAVVFAVIAACTDGPVGDATDAASESSGHGPPATDGSDAGSADAGSGGDEGSSIFGEAGSGADANGSGDTGSGAKGTAVPTPVTPSWVLTFDDEFDGMALDATKWTNIGNHPSDLSISNTANVSVGNGKLTLQTQNVPNGSASYQGAFVTTNGHFSAATGYLETLMSVSDAPWANSHGLWQAFYTYYVSGSYTEIDTPEWLGRDGYAHMTYHDKDPSGITSGTACGSGSLAGGGYHVYGMSWDASATTFTIDGTQCFQVTSAQASIDTTTPQAIDVENAVGGWGGINLPDSATTWPAYQRLEYVHFYCNPSVTTCPPAVAPQAGYGGPGDTMVH